MLLITNMKLDIACGQNKQKGFKWVDIAPGEGVDFVWDLEHLNQVGLENRAELRNRRERKSQLWRNVLYYSALVLAPVAILLLIILAGGLR